MKKKAYKAYMEERENPKPWMLLDISPQVKKMAKDAAKEYRVKVGEWVSHAIIEAYNNRGGDETIRAKGFAEMMEEFPDKGFMQGWFIGVMRKIEDLSKKIDKPWWKFWA